MARQQRAQSVRAFTPPAAAQFGAQVFVFVGTNAHKSLRLKETDLIRKAGLPFPRAAGFKWRSGACVLCPAAALTTKIIHVAGDAAISGMPENSGKQTRTNGNMTRHEIGRPRCGRNGTFSLIFRTVGAVGGGRTRTYEGVSQRIYSPLIGAEIVIEFEFLLPFCH